MFELSIKPEFCFFMNINSFIKQKAFVVQQIPNKISLTVKHYILK